METWQSGLMRRVYNPERQIPQSPCKVKKGSSLRGFKSHRLRHQLMGDHRKMVALFFYRIDNV